jgi:hypothetical protein
MKGPGPVVGSAPRPGLAGESGCRGARRVDEGPHHAADRVTSNTFRNVRAGNTTKRLLICVGVAAFPMVRLTSVTLAAAMATPGEAIAARGTADPALLKECCDVPPMSHHFAEEIDLATREEPTWRNG